ncbi:hypothetical protein MNB_SV-15-499 [hydrothermal vent metagenome]|uniref:Outer membrane protein W n=1 Tax=hydrothermal vent metagenome TaxID=652676 RepID=A0A1W1EJ09_9ZZZZ
MKKLTLSLVVLLSINVYAGGDITPPVIDVIVPDVVPPMVTPDYAVDLKVGTLGLGLDFSMPINEQFNVRLNLNGGSYDDTSNEAGIDYSYSLDLLTAGILVDYYPMSGSEFRVSGGVYYNGNEADLCARPQAGTNLDIGLKAGGYSVADLGSLKGNVDFDDIAPYVGIGWGNAVKNSGWSFNADVGIMYQGTPDVTLEAIGSAPALKAEIDANVAIEEADLQNDLDDYKIYPVISVGVTYTF